MAFKVLHNVMRGRPKLAGEASTRQNRHLCGICLDDVEFESMKGPETCVHKYCHTCFTRYLQESVRARRYPVTCPSLGCTAVVTTPQALALLVDPDDKDLVGQLEVEHAIPAEEKFYCPHPTCSALLVVDHAHPDEPTECPLCHHKVCLWCRDVWHDDISCAQFKSHSLSDGEVLALARKQKWQQCAQCLHLIELTQGCNHMTCRCGYEFCYKCGEAWTAGGPGCDCTLFDEDTLRREAALPQEHRLDPGDVGEVPEAPRLDDMTWVGWLIEDPLPWAEAWWEDEAVAGHRDVAERQEEREEMFFWDLPDLAGSSSEGSSEYGDFHDYLPDLARPPHLGDAAGVLWVPEYDLLGPAHPGDHLSGEDQDTLTGHLKVDSLLDDLWVAPGLDEEFPGVGVSIRRSATLDVTDVLSFLARNLVSVDDLSAAGDLTPNSWWSGEVEDDTAGYQEVAWVEDWLDDHDLGLWDKDALEYGDEDFVAKGEDGWDDERDVDHGWRFRDGHSQSGDMNTLLRAPYTFCRSHWDQQPDDGPGSSLDLAAGGLVSHDPFLGDLCLQYHDLSLSWGSLSSGWSYSSDWGQVEYEAACSPGARADW